MNTPVPSSMQNEVPPGVLPGLWREEGGLSGLVRLDVPASTPGMVVVAKRGEPWQQKPELRWQAWPDLLVPDAAEFKQFAGQQDPVVALLQRVAGLNRDAGEIGAGMFAQLVDEARRLLATGTAAVDDESAPAVRALRAHNGYVIPGHHLELNISADTERDGIRVNVSLTAAAIQMDRGVWLTETDAGAYPPAGITVDGDRLTCSRPYEGGLTDFRDGFAVTLEPGQAHAVRHAVAGAQRVLEGYAGAVAHLRPWLDTVQPSAWYVTQPLSQLIVAYVLDAATHDEALAAFDQATSSDAPADARLRIADPVLWGILKNARDHRAPQASGRRSGC